MAVTIDWRHGDGTSAIINPSGTNNTVGFFGSAFGFSVKVGEYQDKTSVTDIAGAGESGVLKNNKFIASGIVETDTVSGLISDMTVNDATVRIHFNNSTDPVRLQTTEFRAFDGALISSGPSGVTIQAFELSTTSSGVLTVASASGVNSGGDVIWEAIAGATVLDLIDHPFTDNDHYHYVAMSATPTSIGQKTFGFFYQTEFL